MCSINPSELVSEPNHRHDWQRRLFGHPMVRSLSADLRQADSDDWVPRHQLPHPVPGRHVTTTTAVESTPRLHSKLNVILRWILKEQIEAKTHRFPATILVKASLWELTLTADRFAPELGGWLVRIWCQAASTRLLSTWPLTSLMLMSRDPFH